MTRSDRIVRAAEMLHWISISNDRKTVLVDAVSWQALIDAIKSKDGHGESDALTPANAQKST